MDGARLWQAAASVAARAHAGQVRKDGITPYIAHPIRVALIVRQEFGCDDPACLAAALLHDVIEDTPADYDEIAGAFGTEVAAVVATLTKDMRLPEAEREQRYDAALRDGCWRARVIKLADAFDNLCDVGGTPGLGPAALRKAIGTCERAIAIAEHDSHPAVVRGIEALRAAMAACAAGHG